MTGAGFDHAADWPVHPNPPTLACNIARAHIGAMLDRWPMSPAATERHLRAVYAELASAAPDLDLERIIPALSASHGVPTDCPLTRTQLSAVRALAAADGSTRGAAAALGQHENSTFQTLRRAQAVVGVRTTPDLLEVARASGWL